MTPVIDSIFFPGRLLMQDERSALHTDKAKPGTPACGLILSFPGKKAAENPWAALRFTSVSRPLSRSNPLWTWTKEEASHLPKFWICMKSP